MRRIATAEDWRHPLGLIALFVGACGGRPDIGEKGASAAKGSGRVSSDAEAGLRNGTAIGASSVIYADEGTCAELERTAGLPRILARVDMRENAAACTDQPRDLASLCAIARSASADPRMARAPWTIVVGSIYDVEWSRIRKAEESFMLYLAGVEAALHQDGESWTFCVERDPAVPAQVVLRLAMHAME